MRYVHSGDDNVDDDPLFVDVDGPDNVHGTGNDNLRMSSGFPCTDAGNNAAVPEGVTNDVDGNPRIVMVETSPVDMGA